MQDDPNPLARAKHYRALAQRTREHAKTATDPEVQTAYALVAQHWDSLADEVERMAAKLRLH